MMPLIVQGAAEKVNRMSWLPGFIIQKSVRRPLSTAEYAPAASIAQQTLTRALQGRTIIPPSELTAALEGTQHQSIDSAVRAAAEKTGVGGVLTIEVSEYEARNAGLENAQATGRVGVVLYDAQARLIWSISATVVKGPVGTNAAPSLTQFMEYAMERLEPEVRAMASGG